MAHFPDGAQPTPASALGSRAEQRVGVVDQIRHMHLHCYDVQFGSKPSYSGIETGNFGERYANKRAEMYGAARAWLKTGAIPNDPDFKSQLLAITYSFNNRDEILLTSKEEMMDDGVSPDDVDAFVLTFAYPLAAHVGAGGEGPHKSQNQVEYNPFSPEMMVA